MGKAVLIPFLACLTLCLSIASGHAELNYQSQMIAVCRPAVPREVTVQRWSSAPACGDHCFTWRLLCSNGKTQLLQSRFHPSTTVLGATTVQWAPWSYGAYLGFFMLVSALGIIAARRRILLLVLDGVLVAYAAAAARALHQSVVASPWSLWAELDRAVFLNPYLYGLVVAVFIAVNAPAFVRAFELFRYRPLDPVFLPSIIPTHPMQVNALHAPLMPNLHEFAPGVSAARYRWETEQLLALKRQYNARRAQDEAQLREARARNGHDEQPDRSQP